MNLDILNIKPTTIKFLMNEIEISDKEIYSYLGYKDSFPDDYVSTLISQLKAEAIAICRPKFGFRIINGEIIDKTTILLEHSRSFHPGRIITYSLKDSELFAIIIASIGKEMDQWITAKREGLDIMEAFIADALGSTIVEAIVVCGMEYLKKEMSKNNLGISNSYSPGYCGWDVAEQQMLFSLLPANFCGVTLTESSLMLPIKSVSALVGLGTNIVKKPYGCAICRKKDCFKRRL